MNIIQNTTSLASWIWQAYVKEDMVSVDATCGNGHDTLWLAQKSKKVYAFDIQPEALKITEELLKNNGMNNCNLILDSHANIDRYVKEHCQLIVFNLGYLPGADKQNVTNHIDTLTAVKKSIEKLDVGGLLSIMMYQGHTEGRQEKECLLSFAKELDKSKYHCIYTNMLNQPNNPPELLLITRKK